jgi:hypothetical protein
VKYRKKTGNLEKYLVKYEFAWAYTHDDGEYHP